MPIYLGDAIYAEVGIDTTSYTPFVGTSTLCIFNERDRTIFNSEALKEFMGAEPFALTRISMDKYPNQMFAWLDSKGHGYATALGQTLAFFELNGREMDFFSLASRFDIQVGSAQGRVYNLKKALWAAYRIALVVRNHTVRLSDAADSAVADRKRIDELISFYERIKKARMLHTSASVMGQISGEYNYLLSETQAAGELAATQRDDEVRTAIAYLQESLTPKPLYQRGIDNSDNQENQEEA